MNYLRFLPANSVNEIIPTKLIIKKSPAPTLAGRMKDDQVDDDDDDRGSMKKKSSVASAEDKSRREDQVCELMKKLDKIQRLMARVQKEAEELLKKQAESEEFQKQMKKETEGYDIQRGVYRVIDALDGDRRELSRLQKKSVEMRKRQLNGKELGRPLLVLVAQCNSKRLL